MLIDRLATILPDDTTPTIFREEYFVVSLVQEAGYSFEFTWLKDNIEIWVFRKSLLSPNLNIHFGGSRFVSWTDPLFHETDPRIRIQIQINETEPLIFTIKFKDVWLKKNVKIWYFSAERKICFVFSVQFPVKLILDRAIDYKEQGRSSSIGAKM